ncbi:hypothetical protein L6164_036289 [Bauhinia variegata]|uniref:Uncharacterized protein n=1 Tax=Bauhinia variegata TaxID=167791 RepID=A0ACB9KHD1_BAUVA|nr:hypothetical protein L6164_036289 [Bauhinia variegata]
MDLNKKAVLCPLDAEFRKNDNFGDTTLCLNGLGFGESSTSGSRPTENNIRMKFSNASDDGCKLVLGLGPPPRAYSDDFHNLGFNKKKELDSLFSQRMPSDCGSILQLGLSGGTNEGKEIRWLYAISSFGSKNRAC